MLDRVVDALSQDPHLDNIVGEIDATGEAEWTVTQAKEEDIEVPSIELALAYRRRSKTEEKVRNSFTARMVAALRNAFGGHAVKKKE
jgi:6-phosphogluconate dehydrogenase